MAAVERELLLLTINEIIRSMYQEDCSNMTAVLVAKRNSFGYWGLHRVMIVDEWKIDHLAAVQKHWLLYKGFV